MDFEKHSVREVLNNAFNMLKVKNPYDEKGKVEPQDFSLMTKMTEDFGPGHTAVVVGTTPTPLLCAIAGYLAVERKARMSMLCFKDSPEHLLLEMLSYLSHIPRSDIFTHKIAPPYFPAFNDTCASIYDAELSFCQLSEHDLQSLRHTLWSSFKEHHLDMLVIDELGLLGGTSSRADLSALGAELQSIARTESICIAAGCIQPDAESQPLGVDEQIHSDGFTWG